MPRPRRLKHPVKINLLIDKSSKEIAVTLANKRQMSISRLFESLLQQEAESLEIKDDSIDVLENL
jgi:hypothetical protein